LLVDDTPEAESYVARSLRPDLPLANVRQAAGEAELFDLLAHDRFDVVVTEAQLSWTNGLGILRAVKERQPEPPVLMLTSDGDAELAAEAIQAGFDAYLRKAPGQQSRLGAAVRAALETARERVARQRADEERAQLWERE
jgi:DNA-binding NarL/FixJ family response regulator